MTTYPTTYAEADAILTGRCQQRRKVANNTYCERRESGDIAVRLHSTDIATFHPDGTLTLDTGGWATVTTKDRVNRALGNRGRVWSDRGRWHLRGLPFADGITLDESGDVLSDTAGQLEAVAAEDAANARMRRDVSRFMRSITPADVVRAFGDTSGDCWLCMMRQADCLASHVEEGYFHATLALRAVEARGYYS
jgi:hypothetical protein